MAAVLEPISPELVLVCPELREQALLRQPDPWEAFLVGVKTRTTPVPADAAAGSMFRVVLAALVEPVLPLLVFAFFLVVATTVLTFVSDLVR